MVSKLETDYDRQFENAEAQAIARRADNTTSVLSQLGAAYQNLPEMGLAQYQAESTALKNNLSAVNALIDQIRTLLVAIDTQAGPLDAKNKRALATLRGLLRNDADIALLDQITGPSNEGPIVAPPLPPGP